MKAFQFSLEQILELRLEEEQEAEVRLGRLVSEWNRLNQKRQDCLERKKQLKPRVSAADILQNSLYSSRLDQEIQRYQRAMDDQEPLLEQLREEYRKARASREGLEKLKEKRKKEHKKKAQHRETLFLDDLSQNMRRMNNSSE